MRITGGQYRGRNLRTPKSGVRPTQDMVRQAVFNILMSRVPDARFLDLYAGSGAVGLEALSRGAAEITWVEQNRSTLAVLRANVSEVGGQRSEVGSNTRVVADDALRFLRRAAGRPPYDIIYADPPYADARTGQQDPLTELLELIREGQVLAKDGIFMYESPGGRRASKTEAPEGWQTVVDREYGKTRIRAFARTDST